jgi:microcystin-dependent protein
VPVETFNYLDSLNPSNPPTSDGLVGGDDHLRGIKATLKTTFPNITGAITATQGDLNGAAGIFTNGAGVLADAGAMFKTNSTDGFKNPLAGDIDVYLQGAIAATWSRALSVNTYTVNGKITATGEIKGPGVPQPGATMIWWDDTLPTDGLWAFANGQIVANANIVCPILLARWGNRFGGNGVTTMGLPNLQEVVPVGKSTMGGASAPGLLSTISTGVKQLLAAIFGSETHTLTAGQLPSITSANTNNVSLNVSSSTGDFIRGPTSTQAGTGTATISGVASGAVASSGTIVPGAITSTSNNTSGQAHNNLQPSMVVNWIIRLG